jgi:DNA-directed RNA polymerase subunit L
MKISTVVSNDTVTVTVSDLQINVLMAFTNAIRRTLLSKIPVMGMQSVDITKNTMLLHHNQEITHKLSSIPVVMYASGGGDGDTVTATFDVTATTAKTVFTSNDIITPSGLKLHSDIPIVTLLVGETLSGTITFGYGIASENALKYSAIIVPEYKIVDNSSIVMNITTKSHYTVSELIDTCRSILLKDIDSIYASTGGVNDIVTINTVETELGDNTDSTTLVQFFINGYDHTIGNMISTIINAEMDVTFAGYCKLHPSNEVIMVSIRSIDPIDDFKNALIMLKDLVKKIVVS